MSDECMDAESDTAATIDVRLDVSNDLVETTIEMAGYGIGYWAMTAMWLRDKKVYVVEPQDYDYPVKELTYAQIAQAMGQLAFNDVNLRSDLRGYIRTALLEKEGGDIDADVADVVIQFAMFGEIVFG